MEDETRKYDATGALTQSYVRLVSKSDNSCRGQSRHPDMQVCRQSRNHMSRNWPRYGWKWQMKRIFLHFGRPGRARSLRQQKWGRSGIRRIPEPFFRGLRIKYSALGEWSYCGATMANRLVITERLLLDESAFARTRQLSRWLKLKDFRCDDEPRIGRSVLKVLQFLNTS